MNLSLLLVGLMLIVGWQILTWLQSCFWPSRPLVTAVEGLGIQVPLLDESPAAFKSRVSRAVTRRRIRIIVAPVIAIAVIASAVASGFVASAVVLSGGGPCPHAGAAASPATMETDEDRRKARHRLDLGRAHLS